MASPNTESRQHPLLESLLEQKGLKLQGTYTVRDVAKMFDVSSRTIQQWCADGKLPSRHLPGRAKFLSEDLEQFLRESLRDRKGLPTGDVDARGLRIRSAREQEVSGIRESAPCRTKGGQSSLFKQS